MNWKKYYKLPLHLDYMDGDVLGDYAWDKKNQMALMFASGVNSNDKELIIKIINGTLNKHISNLRFDGVDFYDGDTYIFCIRGWGNLIGIGANSLPHKKASEVQDQFRDFVYDKLK